jgi:hypothetical protein
MLSADIDEKALFMSNTAYPAISPDEFGVTLAASELFEKYLMSRSARGPAAAKVRDVPTESFTAAILARAAQLRAVLSGNPRLAEAIYQTLHR